MSLTTNIYNLVIGLNKRSSTSKSTFDYVTQVGSSNGGRLDARCATNRIFQVLGNIHDLEAYYRIENSAALNATLFISHWAHLAIIFMWIAGNFFHIGWTGNYELWILNPVKTIPIAHSIFDPHMGSSEVEMQACYSGLYNWLYSTGFTSNQEIYNLVISFECLSLSAVLLAFLHLIFIDSYLQWMNGGTPVTIRPISKIRDIQFKLNLAGLVRATKKGMTSIPLRLFTFFFDGSALRLNFHIGALIGLSSVAWAGHIIHQALPVSRGIKSGFSTLFTNGTVFGQDMDKDNHIYGSTYGAGNVILSFFGGLKSETQSLYLSDISHHHLAIGVVFIVAGHLYQSLYEGFGHRVRDILFVSGTTGNVITQLLKSQQLNLSLALLFLGFATSMVAQHIYALLPYVYLSYITSVALYCHHQYIASFLMMGGLIHASIFLVRDYVASPRPSVIDKVLLTKGAIISHLSWVSLLLGFHVLGVWMHNDTVVAFSDPEKQILIEPVFAINLQSGSGIIALGLGPGDLLAHHAFAFAIHTTVLIMVKGALDSRGSKLMPDKLHFGYSFACDGPTRGGTCDISAWDAAYLAGFWMLNTDAWVMFYFHWKNLTLFENTTFQFDESSTTLNGWFRDYLWFNSGALLNGYNAFRANDLSAWSWLFLAAHLCWATGFMFLISWRGYWAELIDIIILMHLKTPVLYDLQFQNMFTPVALSIVQARLVGLVHFAAGFIFTYAAFVLAATS